MLALFDSSNASPRAVNFKIDAAGKPQSFVVFISSVEREDGSGESWNINGRTAGNQAVCVYFSTKNRCGSLSLEKRN
ncbi:hypothetical protein KKD88_01690 [Patescibacteria group bacterium]|nr:hypothetical protein [Patescibacteria group bacterium]MBU1629767.1 hypothetical protein [Patescibacteria group bacterium]